MIVQFSTRKAVVVNKNVCLALVLFLLMPPYAAQGQEKYCGLIESVNGPPEAYTVGNYQRLPDKPIYHRLTKGEQVCVLETPITKGAGENYIELSLFGGKPKVRVTSTTNSTTGKKGCYQIPENCSITVWDKALQIVADWLNSIWQENSPEERANNNIRQTVSTTITQRNVPHPAQAQLDDCGETSQKNMKPYIPEMLKAKGVKLSADRGTLYLFFKNKVKPTFCVRVTKNGTNTPWGTGVAKEASTIALIGNGPLQTGSYEIQIGNWSGNFEVVNNVPSTSDKATLPTPIQGVYEAAWLVNQGEEWRLEAYQRVAEIVETEVKAGYSSSAALVKVWLEKGKQ